MIQQMQQLDKKYSKRYYLVLRGKNARKSARILSPKKSTTLASSDLDVAAYAKSYSGKSLLERLLHISRVCPSLKRDKSSNIRSQMLQ